MKTAPKPRTLAIRDAAIRAAFEARAAELGVSGALLLERLAADFLASELCANCSIQGKPGRAPIRWINDRHIKAYLCADCVQNHVETQCPACLEATVASGNALFERIRRSSLALANAR